MTEMVWCVFRILHTVDYKRRHKTDRASRRWKRRNADNEKRREKAVCLKKWERPVHMRNVARHKRDKILFGIHERPKIFTFCRPNKRQANEKSIIDTTEWRVLPMSVVSSKICYAFNVSSNWKAEGGQGNGWCGKRELFISIPNSVNLDFRWRVGFALFWCCRSASLSNFQDLISINFSLKSRKFS